MRRKSLLVLAVALSLAGCYRVTVITGAPEGPNKIEKPWNHSFVYGLVPPSEVNTATQCPQGVARVVTEHSFLNSLVAGITYSLYTPITVKVTCASGPVAR